LNTIEKIAFKLNNLPDKPGVYQFYNKEGKIIYVGKAINLKKRVSSYFNRNHINKKLHVLVSNICDIQYIVLETESDALLLENNLIKKLLPRYNVLLKDDKTFPWICIKNELFPRVYLTRNVINDGSVYFGPYTSVVMVKNLLKLLKKLYPLRTCNYNLDQENIKKNKYKTCLEYHIGNCKAPCVELQSQEEYNNNIAQIKNILKGNISIVKNHLIDLMNEYSGIHQYENAQFIKTKIQEIENFQTKSTVVSTSIHDVDVYSIYNDIDYAFVNYLKVINGAIVQSFTLEMTKKLNESIEELLGLAITDIRHKLNSISSELIVRYIPDIKIDNVKFSIPKMGDKLKLLELSERNVQYYATDKIKQKKLLKDNNSLMRVLSKMKEDLKLKKIPVLMECFDISNIQGSDSVASCVVFKNTKPLKKEYRHYNIKTVVGPNDYASMEEVIYRRLKRLIDENKALPDLVVIDGGKGQLHAALKSIEILGVTDKIQIISIAKKLEEIFIPNDSVPLYLDKKSETLQIIQQIRDEAHRFGVSFHRSKRSAGMISSEMINIKGIGEKIVQKLIVKYKTINNIKELSIKELSETIEIKKAELVYSYFHKN